MSCYRRLPGAEISEQKIESFSSVYELKTLSGALPAGTAQIRIWTRKSGTTGSLFLDDVFITLTGGEPPTDAYAAWAASNNITGRPEDMTGGLENILRYAFGGDQLTPKAQLIPQMSINPNGSAWDINYSFYRINDPQVQYRLWFSEDLVNWGASPIWEDSGAEGGVPGWHQVNVPTASNRAFLRMEVTR